MVAIVYLGLLHMEQSKCFPHLVRLPWFSLLGPSCTFLLPSTFGSNDKQASPASTTKPVKILNVLRHPSKSTRACINGVNTSTPKLPPAVKIPDAMPMCFLKYFRKHFDIEQIQQLAKNPYIIPLVKKSIVMFLAYELPNTKAAANNPLQKPTVLSPKKFTIFVQTGVHKKAVPIASEPIHAGNLQSRNLIK